jgi:hypothetical protein
VASVSPKIANFGEQLRERSASSITAGAPV